MTIFSYNVQPSASGPTPPPNPFLIESFDNLAFYSSLPHPSTPYAAAGDVAWYTNLDPSGYITLSTDHVTQGTHSWEIVVTEETVEEILDLSSGTLIPVIARKPVDLTGYTSLSIDIYIADIGGDMWVYFNAFNQGGHYEDGLFITATTTGAHTLTLDLTLADWDLSTTEIYMGVEFNDSGGTFHVVDAFFDNLRATY